MTTELPINRSQKIVSFPVRSNVELEHAPDETTIEADGFEIEECVESAELENCEKPMDEGEYAIAFQTGFQKTVRFLRSRGASEDIAEEVAQAAWARGWERLHQLRNPKAVGVWVASIAKHLWRNRIVREQRQQELDETVATKSQSEAGILWDQIVSVCAEEERHLLVLHYVNGYTSREIADKLGCSALAVRLRLMRVRRKIDQTVSSDLLLKAA